MDRCWLKGAEGDALHAVLCAAGLNICWLLRAIARMGLPGLLSALFELVLYAAGTTIGVNQRPTGARPA
jgi:IS5 family transposase